MLGGWLNYGKPATGLRFLRNEVLDSAQFDYAFREYTRRWAFKHPTPADFFRSMNDALGEDLSWFWRSWFYRTDHLDQAVDSVQQRDSSGTTTTRIFLSNKREMVAPLDLTVTRADGTSERMKFPVELWYRGMAYDFRVRNSSAARPVRVVLDARNVYPDVNRANNVWTAPATAPTAP
jgi:aminopeptidase N